MADKKTVDWQSILLAVIPPIVTSSLLLGNISAYFTEISNDPNLRIAIKPTLDNLTSLEVSNEGAVPATNLKLLVTAPYNITDYQDFAVENLTTMQPNPTTLELYAPRMVQGGGSIIRLNLTTDTPSTSTFQNYNVYATYDQGSVISSGAEPPASFYFVNFFTSTPGLIVLSVIMGVGFYFYYRLLRKVGSNSLFRRISRDLDETDSSLKSSKSGEIKNKELKRLDEISEYMKRKPRSLTKDHRNTLENRILEIKRTVIWINRIVIDSESIFVFGKNFGSDKGLVYYKIGDERERLTVSDWTDSGIQAKRGKQKSTGNYLDSIEIITIDGREIIGNIDRLT